MNSDGRPTELEFHVLSFACADARDFDAYEALIAIHTASAETIEEAAGGLVRLGFLYRTIRDSRRPVRYRITAEGFEYLASVSEDSEKQLQA
ncbi:MAG: hypothetical protein ABIP75_00155 [Pyrinomonadaceae bacterium]